MPGKQAFANFPKGSSLKTQAHKGNFLIFFIFKDLEVIDLMAEVQWMVIGQE